MKKDSFNNNNSAAPWKELKFHIWCTYVNTVQRQYSIFSLDTLKELSI